MNVIPWVLAVLFAVMWWRRGRAAPPRPPRSPPPGPDTPRIPAPVPASRGSRTAGHGTAAPVQGMDGPPQEAPAPAPPERTLDLADDEPGRPHLRGRQNWVGAGVGLVALALAALVLSASYNRIPVTPDPGRQTGLPADGPSTLTALAGADPRRAPALFRSYGCVSCHVIPGVSGASGRVGPNLAHLYDHALIAGVLANTPENLLLWIRAPQQVDPNTGMPNLGVSTKDARDIAAYLQTLLQGRGRHD